MLRIKTEEGRFLEVDFQGILTEREEEVIAWKFLGKSRETISIITGSKPETIKKQNKRTYEKTDTSGADNPLALLMCKSFQMGWAKFLAVFIFVLTGVQQPRIDYTRTRTPAARVVRHLNRSESFIGLTPSLT